MPFRQADAAHVQAFQRFGLKILPDNQFCAAAPNVYYQLLFAVIAQAVSDPKVNESRLFSSGYNLYGVAQGFFGLFDEVTFHPHLAQCIGTHDP